MHPYLVKRESLGSVAERAVGLCPGNNAALVFKLDQRSASMVSL